MEVQIYYRIWKYGKNLSQMSLCEIHLPGKHTNRKQTETEKNTCLYPIYRINDPQLRTVPPARLGPAHLFGTLEYIRKWALKNIL